MPTLDELLAQQRGLLTRAQLLAAGVPAARIDERVRTRAWTPVLPRTYLLRPGAEADELRVRAAVLWAGADAVLTGLAAAWWLRMVAAAPATVRVAAPHRTRVLRRPEAVAEPRRPVEVVEVRGLRVTAAPVTLVDAAVELGAAGVRLLETAQVRLPGPVAVLRDAAVPAGVCWILRDLRHRGLVRSAADRGRVPDHRLVSGPDSARRR